MASTITLDLTNLDRTQTFELIHMISDDEEHLDENTDALTAHATEHAFDWVLQADREGDEFQSEFLRIVCLPDDYDDEGIWYDQIGWRYDRNDWSVTTRSGEVFFNDCGWLDSNSAHWDLVEEAARIYSRDGMTNEVRGIATTLEVLTRNLAPKATARPDKYFWAEYIAEFAKYNYKDGERTE